MFKMLFGMVISYGVFNENGRAMMNTMGNKLIEISKTKIKVGTTNADNKSSNCESNDNKPSGSNSATATNTL